MTQAGGRLTPDRQKRFYEIAVRKNIRFFVMYGQTEATARISYVPFENLGNKFGSIGIPIPGGKLAVENEGKEIHVPGTQGELVYTGPNVMMGYADSRADLSKGDELHGTLHTGDVGYVDADGYFFVTGRIKRFIKVFGLRLNLDEVEVMLDRHLRKPVACVGADDSLMIVVETDAQTDIESAKSKVVDLYHLHHSVVHGFRMESLPKTLNGKRDYAKIKEEVERVDR
jgi:long-chain acyl-CoA synthetase